MTRAFTFGLGLALLAAGCGADDRAEQSERAAVREANVSRVPGRQREATITVHPTDGRILLAGSNSRPGRAMRAYASTDGGATWTSEEAPPLPAGAAPDSCAADPAVGIDRAGRQYYAFALISPCTVAGYGAIYVGVRDDPRDGWRTPPEPVAVRRGSIFDDKPALAVDTSAESPHSNRVYVAWTRESREERSGIVLAWSDDGTRWSEPTRITQTRSVGVSYASVSVARNGHVYVAWHDWVAGAIFATRSTDGGATFGAPSRVARAVPRSLGCSPYGTKIPAQRESCVRASPMVAVDASRGPFAGRVYVSYAAAGANGSEDVFVAALSAELEPVARTPTRVTPRETHRADQFWPASAVDASRGTLWVCFYDTRADRRRVRAHYSCTASADGARTFVRPVRAASVASDATERGAERGRGAREYGDYQGLAVANGVAHPIWTDTRRMARLQEEIYTATLTAARLGLPRGS